MANFRLLSYAGAIVLIVTVAPGGASAQRSARTSGDFVASSRGEVYYWVGCDDWRGLSPQNLRWFPTATDAESAGYRESGVESCRVLGGTTGTTSEIAAFCTVERVIDGDTLVCHEGRERLRLLLVDAPELAQGEAGEMARAALARLVPIGRRLTVELDVQERDRYGRVLGYLFTREGAMINEEMTRQGYAVVVVYPPNVRHLERMRAAAEEARAASRGFWAGSAFECAPADFRQGECP